MTKNDVPKNTPARGVRRVPKDSFLYERVVPIAMIVMTVLMALVLLAAAGFVLGLIRY